VGGAREVGLFGCRHLGIVAVVVWYGMFECSA
jgi:hypothetical protein